MSLQGEEEMFLEGRSQAAEENRLEEGKDKGFQELMGTGHTWRRV